MSLFEKIFGSYSAKELARIEPIKQKVLDLDEEYQGLSDESLKHKTIEFRERLEKGDVTRTKQNEEEATYCSMLTKKDGEIN